VVGALRAGDPDGPRRAAALLNDTQVAIVQHEYGIYGGVDGAEVLDLLDALEVPVVVVLHTVLAAPTAGQRSVLEAVVARADAVVTMSATARDRLARGYVADLGKVSVIPHGAPDAPHEPAPHEPAPYEPAPYEPGRPADPDAPHELAAPAAVTGRRAPTILTWGLLGPGKGIEWGIEAMATLRRTVPAAQYIVAGQTHPKVLAHAGETYRRSLAELVRRHGLEDSVVFEPHYRDAAALAELVRSADVVLLPYDSTEQVTSGVLIEAVASLTPVVATRFPHAVELLARGTGLLVPHRDPLAIAEALHTVLTRPDLAAGMRRVAATAAPGMRWPAVAARYRALTEQLVAAAGVAA
jgi:glycosyltransferase involved in cell wall biosynthesis